MKLSSLALLCLFGAILPSKNILVPKESLRDQTLTNWSMNASIDTLGLTPVEPPSSAYDYTEDQLVEFIHFILNLDEGNLQHLSSDCWPPIKAEQSIKDYALKVSKMVMRQDVVYPPDLEYENPDLTYSISNFFNILNHPLIKNNHDLFLKNYFKVHHKLTLFHHWLPFLRAIITENIRLFNYKFYGVFELHLEYPFYSEQGKRFILRHLKKRDFDIFYGSKVIRKNVYSQFIALILDYTDLTADSIYKMLASDLNWDDILVDLSEKVIVSVEEGNNMNVRLKFLRVFLLPHFPQNSDRVYNQIIRLIGNEADCLSLLNLATENDFEDVSKHLIAVYFKVSSITEVKATTLMKNIKFNNGANIKTIIFFLEKFPSIFSTPDATKYYSRRLTSIYGDLHKGARLGFRLRSERIMWLLGIKHSDRLHDVHDYQTARDLAKALLKYELPKKYSNFWGKFIQMVIRFLKPELLNGQLLEDTSSNNSKTIIATLVQEYEFMQADLFAIYAKEDQVLSPVPIERWMDRTTFKRYYDAIRSKTVKKFYFKEGLSRVAGRDYGRDLEYLKIHYLDKPYQIIHSTIHSNY